MSAAPRVALFSDSHYEANGVARTTNALERYARARELPLLSVHAGAATRTTSEGSLRRLELSRWRATSFNLEHDLRFDVAMCRKLGLVRRTLNDFQPDVLHFTGPSDIGQLGAYLGWRLGIPMVGSWHTNLHEYAAKRLRLSWLGTRTRNRVHRIVERAALDVCVRFYRIPAAVVAPNREWQALLNERTGSPTFVMSRGVDTDMFTPAKRARVDSRVNVGYVGRLSPEKGVRRLADVARELRRQGRNVSLTIVGEGSERDWLTRNIDGAWFPGVLRGEALARAYANMDVFAFPSETETVGNVVLEAMASGVPVVAMARGGPKFVASSPSAAFLARTEDEFVDRVAALAGDRRRRARMAAAARSFVLTRTWDQIFDGLYRVYETAMRPAGEPAADLVEPSMEGVDA